MVRVRTAPSPTGVPHIGNTWAALFNFIFARKNKGKFVLRLEDTDRARLVPGSVEKIYETLKWLGLDYDEGPDIGGQFGPYLQSERLDIYRKNADLLLEKGLVYKDNGALRFRTEKEGKTSWHDLVGDKDVSFDNSTQEDCIIIKSDGFPTYNFANVIDDHLMEITHVIRGNEFVSSTPKHLMLYKAFGWVVPQFAHLPVLVGADRAKLSKRYGAKSVLELREEGYLKEAIINFMALLGWSHPEEKEIFDLEELISVFDFNDFNSSSSFFDTQKLNWINGEYIRKTQNSKLKSQIFEFYGGKYGEDIIERTVPLVKERIKTLSEYKDLAGFFFEEPNASRELFTDDAVNHLEVAKKVVETIDWDVVHLQENFLTAVREIGFKTGDFFMSLRIAITGSKFTPPIIESIHILGKEKSISRVNNALKIINTQ